MSHLDSIGSIETADLRNGAKLVSAHGSLDGRVAGELGNVLLPFATDGAAVVLDLGDAHGVDETTLDVLGRAAHAAAMRGERLAIVTRSETVVEMLRECGLDEIVEVCSSIAEADLDD